MFSCYISNAIFEIDLRVYLEVVQEVSYVASWIKSKFQFVFIWLKLAIKAWVLVFLICILENLIQAPKSYHFLFHKGIH